MTADQLPEWLFQFNFSIYCSGGLEILPKPEFEALLAQLKTGPELVAAIFGNLPSFSESDALAELQRLANEKGMNTVTDWCFENDRCGMLASATAALSGATAIEGGGLRPYLESAISRQRCQAERGNPKLDEVKSICVQAIQEFLRPYQK